MKVLWFHLMPYPDLPDDFNTEHRSVWVDIDQLGPRRPLPPTLLGKAA